MSQFALVSGAIFGLLAVIFGAFGAHVLKEKLTPDLQKSFETGVKYQMYHAIVLMLLGFNLPLTTPLENYIIYAFLVGIFLFSFSIYGLVVSAAKGKKLRFLGPVTPLGGILLLVGWALLIVKLLF